MMCFLKHIINQNVHVYVASQNATHLETRHPKHDDNHIRNVCVSNKQGMFY